MRIFAKITLASGMLLTFLFVAPQTAAAYTNSRLMDDMVFDKVNTMTEQQIRDFINSRPTSCLAASGAIFPEPITYWQYGSNVDAARVIYNAAQYNDINPQVILATLQKEQSLITRIDCFERPSGIDSRNKAMGQGCPDNGPCPAPAYAGFQQQVMKGSWQLAFNRQRATGNINWGDNGTINYPGPYTEGNRRDCSSCSLIYRDGYTIVDGQAIKVETGATASFYRYTPHLGQAFPGIFQGWFGSTYANDTLNPHPDGTLVAMYGRVYLISNGVRNVISNGAVFESYHWKWDNVKSATTGDLALADGTPIATLQPGILFRAPGTSVYTMAWDTASSSWKKQLVTYSGFTNLGYRWDEVLVVTAGDIPASDFATPLTGEYHPTGTFITVPSNGRVYRIENNTLRYVPYGETLYSYGATWTSIKRATIQDAQYAVAADLPYREGTLLYDGSNIFTVDLPASGAATKRPIGPWTCFAEILHFRVDETISIPAYKLPSANGSLVGC